MVTTKKTAAKKSAARKTGTSKTTAVNTRAKSNSTPKAKATPKAKVEKKVDVSALRERRRRKTQQRLAEEEALHAEHLTQLWRSRVPDAFSGYTLDDDLRSSQWNGRLTKSSVRKVEKYLAQPTEFLIFRGTEGLGKSTLASTIIEHLVSFGYTAEYVSVPVLLNDLSFSKEDYIRKCIRPDVLLLDDVGARVETLSDHQKKGIWAIINGRYGNSKMTLMTTNMPLSDDVEGMGLRTWFGESAWARISEDLTFVEFTGNSFRVVPEA